ncbi:MAG: hypothetical protein A3B82_04890 [Methylophilales bacterium RIFCSPHIGHO2_02_FULL_57_10]|nr:MAG: hypothetical protein A3B82_04890 [Methylophilales bacterium RIFCSPHIGHO2_02_FULL_57_10]
MLTKIFILTMLALILASLFSALFFLMKDKGQGERTAKALTIRISLSIALFILLLISFKLGLIGRPA